MITTKQRWLLLLMFALPLFSAAQAPTFVPQLGFKRYADLKFTSDGKFIISSQQDNNTIIIWDMALSKEVSRLRGKFPEISPDSRLLAYVDSKKLTFYDFTNGETIATKVINTPDDTTNPYNHDFLVFSPASDFIALSSTAKSPEIIVYNIAKKTVALRTSGYEPVFTSDNKYVVYSQKNKIIKRDLNTQLQSVISVKGSVIKMFTNRPDTEMIAITEKNDDTVRIFKVNVPDLKLVSTAEARFGSCHPLTSVFKVNHINDTLTLLQRRNHYPVIWNVKRNQQFNFLSEADYAMIDPQTSSIYEWQDGSLNFDLQGHCYEDTVGHVWASDVLSGHQLFQKGVECFYYFEDLEPHPVLPVIASGASSRIVLNDRSLNPKGELAGFNFDLRNMFFNPLNNDLVAITQHYVTTFSLDKLQIKDVTTAADIVFSPAGKPLYLYDGDIYMLDSSYKFVDTIFAEQNNYRDSRLSLSDDGNVLAFYNGNEIFTYDAITKKERSRFEVSCIWDKGVSTPLRDMGLSPTGHYLFYINTPGTERSCNESGLLLYDLNETDRKSIFPEHKNLGENDYDFDFEPAALFTADEKYLVYVNADFRTINWFDLALRKNARSVVSAGDILSLALIPGSNQFLTTGHGNITIRNLSNGAVINDYSICSPDIVMARFNQNMTLLALGTAENTIILFDWVKKKTIATLMCAYGRALIFTDDHFYFSSKEMLRAIAFVQGGKAYNFEQFDAQFNRPDIILERIGLADTALIKAYRKAYFKRLKKLNLDPSMFTPEFHIPEIDIPGQIEIPINSEEQNLKINVAASDKKYKLTQLNVIVNDVPLYGLPGYDLKHLNTDSVVLPLTIPLSAGVNRIQVSCVNDRGTESRKATFTINCEKTTRKPNLYLITIGVTNYLDDRMNLKYPVKDCRDLIKMFTAPDGSAGKDYGEIIIDSLFNERATRNNILSLKKKLLASHVDDVVIVSVSGHGLLDSNLDFYYATHDINFSDPAATGLRYSDLEGLLDSIPARKKLLLVDACHSGEVDKESEWELPSVNSANGSADGVVHVYASKGVKLDQAQSGLGLSKTFELMQMMFTDLSRGTGTIVISAAAGTGIAIEGEVWKNGVFTYAILNALKNMRADFNEDGKIMTWELKTYITGEVEKLTNGLQKPTIRTESLDYEWKVW